MYTVQQFTQSNLRNCFLLEVNTNKGRGVTEDVIRISVSCVSPPSKWKRKWTTKYLRLLFTWSFWPLSFQKNLAREEEIAHVAAPQTWAEKWSYFNWMINSEQFPFRFSQWQIVVMWHFQQLFRHCLLLIQVWILCLLPASMFKSKLYILVENWGVWHLTAYFVSEKFYRVKTFMEICRTMSVFPTTIAPEQS